MTGVQTCALPISISGSNRILLLTLRRRPPPGKYRCRENLPEAGERRAGRRAKGSPAWRVEPAAALPGGRMKTRGASPPWRGGASAGGASEVLQQEKTAGEAFLRARRRGLLYNQGSSRCSLKRSRGDSRRVGREAEGGGLLNRYRALKLYRGFESLTLRQYFLASPRKQAG